MISRRSLLSQAGLLAAGGAGLWWLREKVLWPPPRARFAGGATGSGWLPWAPPQGVIIVPVTVDGLTVDALVDSGAQASVMDASLFDRLGPGRAMPLPVVAFGLTGRPQLGRSTRCDVAIGQLSLEGVAAAVLDLSPLAQAAGRPISLVLGMNALGATLVELDFRRRRLAFHARDHAPAAPAGLDWVSLPARLEGRELLVWAQVEGKPVEVALDTGASAALSLSEDRAQALGLLDGRPTGATPTVTLGGASLSRTVRVSSLSFAGRTRRDATVHIYPRPAHGGGLPPGLLGGEALAGLRVLADLGEGGLRVLPAPEPPALPRTPASGYLTLMQRRRFLIAGSALAAGVAAPALAEAPAAAPFAWRRWEVVTQVDLSRPDAPADLWLPVAQTVGSYQKADAPQIVGGDEAAVVRDGRYGDRLAHVRWTREGGPRTVRMVQTVRTRDRVADPVALTAEERARWTAPLPSLPLDGIVRQTADRITAGHAEPKARLRAIYDWVVDNTHRDPDVRGCGFGDVRGMLESGRMGGKCADINSLMVALARASGIPARDAYGVRVGPSAYVKQLGASGEVTKAQHCRAEMWLAGEGWFPVDPADVRKLVLEAKMPIDSPELKAQRERLFGSWEMNWIVYNHATDIVLPGAPHPPEEHFLMYPLAITPGGEVDQLDAKSFAYTLNARQIA